MSKGTVNALDQLCAPDFVDHYPAPGQGPGLEGVKKAFAEWTDAFSLVSLNIEEMVAEQDLVVTRFSMTVKHIGEILGATPTGRQISFNAIDMIKVKDGKCVEAWHQGDEMMALLQIGVRPAV